MAEIKSLYSDSDDVQVAAETRGVVRETEEACAAKQAGTEVAPFNLALLPLALSATVIVRTWKENTGDEQQPLTASMIRAAVRRSHGRLREVLVGAFPGGPARSSSSGCRPRAGGCGTTRSSRCCRRAS